MKHTEEMKILQDFGASIKIKDKANFERYSEYFTENMVWKQYPTDEAINAILQIFEEECRNDAKKLNELFMLSELYMKRRKRARQD